MRQRFLRLARRSAAQYFQQNRVGDLMARATNDLAAIRQIVGPMILYSFQAIFALCISLPIMLNISVKLTLLLLIPMPLVSLTVKILGEQIHSGSRRYRNFSPTSPPARRKISPASVSSVPTHKKTPRSNNSRSSIANTQPQNLRLVKYAAAMRPLLFFFIGLGFVIIVAIGVPMAVAARSRPGISLRSSSISSG